MDFTQFPVEIIYIIFEKLLETEEYICHIYENEWKSIDNRSYFKYNNIEYNFDNYNAYQLCILSIINKKYNSTFNNDIYWEQILEYNNICFPKVNYKKKYIQSIVYPYFKNIDRFYKCKLLQEKIYLKIEENNINYMNELLKDSEYQMIFGKKFTYINMKGYWTCTLKNNIPKKSNNWMTYIFEKRGYPVKKCYEWEIEKIKKLKENAIKNINYYLNEIDLSNKRFNSCELYLKNNNLY